MVWASETLACLLEGLFVPYGLETDQYLRAGGCEEGCLGYFSEFASAVTLNQISCHIQRLYLEVKTKSEHTQNIGYNS